MIRVEQKLIVKILTRKLYFFGYGMPLVFA